jgi:hypothetical protein
MPRLLEPLLIQTIGARFRSFNVTVSGGSAFTAPTDVSRSVTQSRASLASVTSSGVFRMTSSSPLPPAFDDASAIGPLVQPASRTTPDLRLQSQVSDELSKYIAGISHAIVIAHDNWRQHAFLKGVEINGTIAAGGCISGPPLSEMLDPLGPSHGLWGNAAAYTAAISGALTAAWHEWEQTVRVPGLPWYPSFVAIPAPQAPPVSNIPTPLSQLAWSAQPLSPEYLSSLMSRKLTKPGPYSEPLFAAVAEGFSRIVAAWLPTQMVAGVLGTGPVPSFAPPSVPAAPVTGGSIIETGPHFAS